ncbi:MULTISPECIES: DUF3789 domain-containing protein [Enterococcus]|nr:DUF3789 domain-containing protein [Enterococcus lactis]EGP5709210.1 DUF3789 domain-containing protein [Enterococcus faecium]EMF0083161.1 DUF3789 domain-containing protein [Enterococcus hirae]HCC6683709.1 DUF3789 domain-containing protein [Enterococcus faecium]
MILFVGGLFIGISFGIAVTAILSAGKYEDIRMERKSHS